MRRSEQLDPPRRAGNPIPPLKWRAPKATETVNHRVVINHGQAQALLTAVRRLSPTLVASFAVMYYAALRRSFVRWGLLSRDGLTTCATPRYRHGSTMGDRTHVAEWAGHSVNVLLRVCATCIGRRRAVEWRQRSAPGT
jgi:hypothetical protein